MKRICLSIIPLLLLASLSGIAQTVTGAVRGIITDPTGAIVPGATVTVTNSATGVATAAKANQAGEYAIQFLQIGQYKLVVEAAGFTTARYGPFSLEIDQTAKIDIPLTVGAATTTVDVSEQLQPILNTENATLGETFTENTINNVPLNGRDFSQLTVFTPGAVSTGYGTYGQQNSVERSTNANNEADVNGSRQQSNNYLLDGQEINENLNNTIGYNPSPDSLEQIRVIASNANAEFGNVNGGDVIAITKSGSNQFHGSLFAFLEDDKLNANSWQNDNTNTPKASYTQTIFGATFGGPIIKDKLFFFADYEGLREHSGGQLTTSVAPAAFRTGDLSLLLNPAAFPVPIQLYDSQTIDPTTHQPKAYANNQIPNITNPVAKFLFSHPNAYPLPNHATSDPAGINNNFIGPSNSTEKNDQGDVKIDYHFRTNDIISGRYSQGYAQDATVTDPIPVIFPTASNYPDHLAAGTWTHTFSPAIVNSFRASYARIRFNSGVTTDPSGIFGLTGNATVGIPSQPQQTAGFSQQSFNGVESGGPGGQGNGYPSSFGANPSPEIFIDNVFEYSENLTWQKGRHLLKFGGEFTRYQQNSFYPGNDGELGDFTYSGLYSANPLSTNGVQGYPFADFLTDRVNDVQVGDVEGRTGQRQWRDAVFVQDDFKVRPNLTLNIGVRWSFDQPIYEVNNKMANLNLQTAAIEYAGVDGNSRALYNAVYTEFQPRLGFAYSVRPRLVLRGGYGITSYLEGSGANLRLTQNPPFHVDFEQQGQNPTAPGGVYSPGLFYTAAAGFPTAVVPTTTFYAWKQNLRPAQTQEFSLTTEYELTETTALSLGYVGILGRHLIDPQFGNQLTSPGATAPFASVVGQTGVVKITGSDSDSNYNALQATIRQRVRGGLEMTANYTYSKSLTNDIGFYGVTNSNSGQYYQQNAYDFNSEYGPAGFDVRHSLNVTGVYELPFGRGKRFASNSNRFVDEVIGGWKLSGSNVSYSGFPVTVSSPANYSGLVFAFTGAARPDQNLPLHVTNRSINAYFGTAVQGSACGANQNNGTCVYSQQPNNAFGDVRPSSLRGPGYEQIDMSLQKSFALFREHAFDFRVDGFNLFNIASYATPDNGATDSNFGQITNTSSTERHIQLSLKYKF